MNELIEVQNDPDHSGGWGDYCSDLSHAIERIEAGDDVDEVLSNV